MKIDPKVQLVIDKALKLPSWQRFAILVTLIVLVVVAYYFLVHVPKVEELGTVKVQLADRLAKLEEDLELASNLPQHKLVYERMQKVLDKSLEQLPNQSEIHNLLSSVGDLARKQGLEIVGFKPLAEVPKGFYAEVPFDMALLGDYHSVAIFFDQVGKLNRIVNINNLEITVHKASEGHMLTVKCLGTTFRFLSIQEQEAIKKAASPKRGGRGR